MAGSCEVPSYLLSSVGFVIVAGVPGGGVVGFGGGGRGDGGGCYGSCCCGVKCGSCDE